MVVGHSSEPGSGTARSLVIAAGDGRDLAWSHQRVAAELLARSGGRLVHLVLHGGAGTASLVQQARRMASRSPVPISGRRSGSHVHPSSLEAFCA